MKHPPYSIDQLTKERMIDLYQAAYTDLCSRIRATREAKRTDGPREREQLELELAGLETEQTHVAEQLRRYQSLKTGNS